MLVYLLGYLRLSCRQPIRVNVLCFKLREEQLTWGSIVGMRAGEEYGYIHAFKEIHGCTAAVIWGVVKENDCVFPPIFSL